MSYEENVRSVSLIADASVGIFTGVPSTPGAAVPNYGKQYCGLRVTGTNQVGLNVAATTNLIGVLQNKPQKAGAPATVGYSGITNLMAGAAFAAGIEVVCDATGRFIGGATTGVGRRVISLEAATQAGQVVAGFIIG